MREKQFEECTLDEATHVEMCGKVYEIGGSEVKYDSYKSHLKVYKGSDGWQYAHELAFEILGIKPLKEVKPEPIEFEAMFFKHDGKWRTLYLGDNHLPYENSKKARFRCVEILEDGCEKFRLKSIKSKH